MRERSAIASTEAPSWRARLIWKTRSGVGVRSAASAVASDSSCSRSSPGVDAEHPAGPVDLEPAEPLLERLLERAADRHRLAHRLHLGRERRVGGRELLEGEARDLDDDVVEHRLERGRRDAGDVVGQLVERVAHRHLGPDPGDREARRLGGERRRARDPRVHLDDELLARGGIHRELDVAAARRHADLADDPDRRVPHHLVLAVGERHRRGDGDRVAGVHAHRVEVLDRADDDDVVGAVPHHLELELLPADDAPLHQHRAHRRELEPPADERLELLEVVGDAPAGAAQRERRAGGSRDSRSPRPPRAPPPGSGPSGPAAWRGRSAASPARTPRGPRRAGWPARWRRSARRRTSRACRRAGAPSPR